MIAEQGYCARFSAYWSEALGIALAIVSTEPFEMEFHHNSPDFRAFEAAINQGIDSHLSAVSFTQSTGDYGRMKFTVAPESVPVLVRRLMEDGDGEAESLASSICECLNIELI